MKKFQFKFPTGRGKAEGQPEKGRPLHPALLPQQRR